MDEDSGLVKTARIALVALGLAVLAVGVVILEGGPMDSLVQGWGWLLNAVVGGGISGLGLGLGAVGVTGEHRFLDRLRARGDGAERKLRPGEEGRRLDSGKIPAPSEEEGSQHNAAAEE